MAEVFRLFDAIFTLDANKVLGIEYFNNLENTNITETAKFTGRTLSLGEDKYINGLVSYYQNAKIQETFPKNGFLNLRSEEFGIADSQDHSFIVPHNIDAVVKCELLLPGWTRADGAVSMQGEKLALDITRFVVEQKVWGTLDKGAMTASDYANRTVKQADSVYYVRGDNKIQVAATFKNSWNIVQYCLYNAAEVALNRMAGCYAGVEPTSDLQGKWGTIKMRLTYITSVDGVEKIHSITNKYDGETLVDQANGAVDLNKLGLNILGLALKLGNPTLNATQKITNWANRIQTGQIYEYQGSLWVANVVNYTFMHGYLQAKVSFVQNFNQLALRTQLLREKRMTNISQDLIQKSEEIITDYVYFTTNEQLVPGYSNEGIHFDTDKLFDFLRDSFDIRGPYSKIGDAFIYTTNASAAIYIPMIIYGAGNTINFEMSFDHPMNAGNQTKTTRVYAGITFDIDKYETNKVIYTDSYGFADEYNVIAPTADISYTDDFPIASINASSYYFKLSDYRVYKQPNEIFALNYQIAFLPIKGREQIDFIGNGFINECCFVKDLNKTKVARYICTFDRKISILEHKVTPKSQINPDGYTYKGAITDVVSATPQGFACEIDFSFTPLNQTIYGSYKSWAIVDENDNVLFASNNRLPNAYSAKIFFASHRRRV